VDIRADDEIGETVTVDVSRRGDGMREPSRVLVAQKKNIPLARRRRAS
jgi:hypothetical protein